MSREQAIAADRAGRIQEAAMLYEEVLSSGARSLDVLVDLALLYWQATETGFAAAAKLTPEFMDFANRRTSELLEEITMQYPEETAGLFWRRYIGWADFSEPLEIDECREMLRTKPDELIPALFVYQASQGTEMVCEAKKLLHDAYIRNTTGDRYVISVIESVMKVSDVK